MEASNLAKGMSREATLQTEQRPPCPRGGRGPQPSLEVELLPVCSFRGGLPGWGDGEWETALGLPEPLQGAFGGLLSR